MLGRIAESRCERRSASTPAAPLEPTERAPEPLEAATCARDEPAPLAAEPSMGGEAAKPPAAGADGGASCAGERLPGGAASCASLISTGEGDEAAAEEEAPPPKMASKQLMKVAIRLTTWTCGAMGGAQGDTRGYDWAAGRRIAVRPQCGTG